MGSSINKDSTTAEIRSRDYDDSNFIDFITKEVEVFVFRRKTTIGFGILKHHYIACKGFLDKKWRVFEWGSDGLATFTCKKINGKVCRNIGKHLLGKVWEAAKRVSKGNDYSFAFFNCNQWTQLVVKRIKNKESFDCSSLGLCCFELSDIFDLFD